jgi:hypothetical protein
MTDCKLLRIEIRKPSHPIIRSFDDDLRAGYGHDRKQSVGIRWRQRKSLANAHYVTLVSKLKASSKEDPSPRCAIPFLRFPCVHVSAHGAIHAHGREIT